MADSELTVGVLGGMGPEATIDFMSEVLRLTRANKDQDHIRLIVDQNPKVPNRQRAIRSGGAEVGQVLAGMARRLEQAGADFLVMPCNSAHAFEHAIRAATALPFVSILDACIEEIEQIRPAGGCVGLMATDGLLGTSLYQRSLERAGFTPLLPTEEEEERLMSLIHRIKGGDKQPAVAREMAGIGRTLVERGAEVVLAACTEIPLVLDAGHLPVPLVSSTGALARRTVALARRELALPGT